MRMKTRRRRGKGSPAVVSLSHLFPLLGRASKDNCVSSSYALAYTSRVCPMTLSKLDVISTRSRQNSANDKCRSNGRNPRFSFLYLSPSPPVDREMPLLLFLSLPLFLTPSVSSFSSSSSSLRALLFSSLAPPRFHHSPCPSFFLPPTLPNVKRAATLSHKRARRLKNEKRAPLRALVFRREEARSSSLSLLLS